MKSINYRKIAFDTYPPVCAYCGFGIQGILQVAHLNHNRSDCASENLVILCPTCHKMYDGNLIPREILIALRDNPPKIDWSASMKDAGIKAAKCRKARAAGRKAAATRLKRIPEVKLMSGGPENKSHFGPGYHAFDVQNLDQLSPQERQEVLDKIVDIMEKEDKKQTKPKKKTSPKEDAPLTTAGQGSSPPP